MIDRALVTKVLTDLVEIESINPDLVPGGRGELEVARYVVDFFKKAGLEAELIEVSPERFNALGFLRGGVGGRSLMLNGHLDTVGVEGMEEPFLARIENGCLYGRGAQDMKGGIAAALVAAMTLAKEPPLKGNVVVAAVADEEHKSLGTRALLKEFKADAAIVMEPTELEVATAHKGFAWAEIETEGRAAHGSRPEEGQDAIVFMGRVLGEIEKLQEKLNVGPRHPLLGCGSVHASVISGGRELSSYPERCRLSLERRLLPGENDATFGKELSEIVGRLSAQDSRFRARCSLEYWAQPLETAQDSLIAQTLARCASKVLGHEPKFGAQSFWTDAALLNGAGISTVVFGPGGAGLHATLEYVRLEEVVLCAEILAECAKAFCESTSRE